MMAKTDPVTAKVKKDAASSRAVQAVKGMNDLLPAQAVVWQALEATIRRLMLQRGYGEIRTPIVEPTALFVRGLGEVTDIVEKEMYSFIDSMNGDALTLRPENTAGVVRAAIEHNLLYDGGKRLWYVGPMFRHERPQKGRYRQFHQFGVEVMGYASPDVDAEVILVARALWRELGLLENQDVRLEINSLGQPQERRAHREALIRHFESNAAVLDDDARRRLHTNPLRILDSKNPAMQSLIEAAPRLDAYLGEASRRHFAAVCSVLDAVGLAYRVNPRLVRGMDYYNLTVFEWVTDHLGAQGTICGGGRYDGLSELLGGKPAPGIGFGCGLERIVLLLQAANKVPVPPVLDAYAIVPDESTLPVAMKTLETLRQHGLSVLMNAGGGSMKSQFKRADASGAQYALIFGGDEVAAGEVTLKPLRQSKDAAQERLALNDAAAIARALRSTPQA